MKKNASSSSSSSPPLLLQFQSTRITGANSVLSPIFVEFDSVSEPVAKAVDGHYHYRDSQVVQDRQEMINRHSLCLNRLRGAADEVTSLQSENTRLRSLNVELNKKLRLMIQSSVVQNRIGSLIVFGREKRTEKIRPRVIGIGGTEAVDVERFSLPKSISVKSDEYLKTSRGFGYNGGRAPNSTRPRTNALPNVKQKVYVSQGKSHDDEPLEIEVNKQGSFKTELCNKWQDTGDCPYGAHCQFAHGVDELRPVIRHPRYKTEVCRMVLAGVSCPYGHRCHFLHAVAAAHDQELPGGSLKPRPVSRMNRSKIREQW